MQKELFTSYKEAAIYSLGNVANKIVGFVLLPLYTSYLTVEDYGILGLIEPTTQLLFTILTMGLSSAYLRWYSTENNSDRKKVIFFNTNLILFLNTSFFVTVLILLSSKISVLLFATEDYSLVLQIAFSNVFFIVVNPIIFSTFRIEHKAVKFSSIKAIQFTINLLLNIYLIVFLKFGLTSIFVSQLISNLLIFLYFIPLYLNYGKRKFDISLIKELLYYGLPLILSGISQFGINLLNRYILNIYDSLTSVGLFSFSFRITNSIRVLIIDSLALSLSPILYVKLVDTSGHRFVKKNYSYTIFIIMIVFLLASNFSREFIYLISQNESYYESYKYVPFLAFVYIFTTMIYYQNILLTYSKKTGVLSVSTLITAIISIGINFILIPIFKGFGAAYSIIISNIILFFILRYFSKKIYGPFFDDTKTFKMIITGLLITGFNYAIFSELNLYNFIFKLILVLTFPIILYPMNFYEPVEIQRLREFFRKSFKIPK